MNTKWLIRNMLIAVALGLSLTGCSSLVGGVAGGAAGAGAYELSARKQMDDLNKDLEEGRIDQIEYDIRKDQVGRGSLVY